MTTDDKLELQGEVELQRARSARRIALRKQDLNDRIDAVKKKIDDRRRDLRFISTNCTRFTEEELAYIGAVGTARTADILDNDRTADCSSPAPPPSHEINELLEAADALPPMVQPLTGLLPNWADTITSTRDHWQLTGIAKESDNGFVYMVMFAK